MINNPYQTLLEISDKINSADDSMVLFDRIMDSAMDTLNAERGFILLRSARNGADYKTVTARNMSRESISTLRNLSTSIVNRVLKDSKPLISMDARVDNRFNGAESVVIQKIKSVICTPLQYDGRVIGVIYMDSRINKSQFDEAGLKFLEAFSDQASNAIARTQLLENLKSENKQLRKQLNSNMLFPEIIGKSQPMMRIFDLIRDVADSTASVLIEGESGTGKELAARALHKNSSRKDKSFIPIFCGSLSENILESELFGHKKGAFTGAIENRPGLFEEADNGTLFLDEIGEVSGNIQTKLLRVIQQGEVKRVGETGIRHVDVRIISATNKQLRSEVEKGSFREDLYYRLNVINIKMPPLRDRSDDIILLADHFIKNYAYRNKKNVHGLNPDARKFIMEYHWPGNVRELENAMERAVILCRNSEITPDLFDLRKSNTQLPVGKTLKEINKHAILKTIELAGNNRTKAAEILGVSRRWLQYQLKEWGMINEN